jgi:hypothetical protein
VVHIFLFSVWQFCLFTYFIDDFIVFSDADDFEPAVPTVGASDKWEGEDAGDDIKVPLPPDFYIICIMKYL